MTKQVSIDDLIRNILDNVVTMLEESFTISDLKQILYMTLSKYEIYKEETSLSVDVDCTTRYVSNYLVNMKLNGCTDKSVAAYHNDIKNMLSYINKNIKDITYNDLRSWLGHGKLVKKWKDRTYNTKLVEMRGLFTWLYEEDLIDDNPAKKLKETKVERKIGLTLLPEEREEIRCQCKTEKELALCDMLYSTGARISELCSLDIEDIDFNRKTAVVYGKGRKEREIYFSSQAKVHLIKYLKERTDNNSALFVSSRKPYNRMTPESARSLLIKIKSRSERTKDIRLTPHVFRRTVGTEMINKGAPLEIVAEKLGHVKLDTTRNCYSVIAKSTVKSAHERYVG